MGLQRWLCSKESACKSGATGDMGSISGSGKSPGGGHETPLSILAWRIPWTEKPGRLQSIVLQRVWSDLALMHTQRQFKQERKIISCKYYRYIHLSENSLFWKMGKTQAFIGEEKQIFNIYMRRCSLSLAIRDVQ